MRLSRDTVLELMALADGELSGEDKARVERLAAQSEEATRVVGALRSISVGLWLGDAVERKAHLADGIADVVMARLAEDALQSSLRHDVGLQSEYVRQPLTARSRGRRRLVTTAFVGSALAMAAVVAMYMRSGGAKDDGARVAVGSSGGVVISSREHGKAISKSPAVPLGRGVEVEEIDSVLRVSIFELSAMAETSTQSSVVVWIDDEPGQQ